MRLHTKYKIMLIRISDFQHLPIGCVVGSKLENIKKN